jgi:hypothetical protein
MIHLTIGGLFLLGTAASATEAQQTPAEALQTIKRDWQNSQGTFHKDYEKAKTDKDREKLYEAQARERRSCVRRGLELAREHPEGAAAFEALEWIITGGVGYCPETWQALDLVRRKYVSDPRLGKICWHARIYRLSYAATESLLRTVLEKNSHRNVQGIACLTLARVLQSYSQMGKLLRDSTKAKLYAEHYPPDLIQTLQTREPSKLLKEAETLYERTIQHYGDLKEPDAKHTLGRKAQAALFEMHHLQVGQRAPEIDGEDPDGRRFKLSDYRGKVVVLDFWGHW